MNDKPYRSRVVTEGPEHAGNRAHLKCVGLLEDELERLEDKIERSYRDGKLTTTEFRALDRLLDQTDDKIDDLDDRYDDWYDDHDDDRDDDWDDDHDDWDD